MFNGVYERDRQMEKEEEGARKGRKEELRKARLFFQTSENFIAAKSQLIHLQKRKRAVSNQQVL